MTLEIRQLTRRFGAFVALDRVSLDVAPGELVALLGPSGSGKSTLLRILAGLDAPDQGSVLRDGEDLLAHDASRRGVGLVFQHYALFAHMTVFENVAFGLRVRRRALRPGRQAIRQRVLALLERMQLAEYAARYPSQLSGGQRQRVALARALAVEPAMLLLDEPFGALDQQVRVSLRGWLRDLQRSLGLTTLMVTHDQEEALQMADRVVVMHEGRVAQVGRPDAIYDVPASPFVHGFVGRGTRLPAIVVPGALLVSGHRLAGDTEGWEPGREVEAWVRPEDVRLAPRVPWGVPARIESLLSRGATVHAALAIDGASGITLDAEWHAGDVARLSLHEGDQVAIAFARLRLYGTEPDPRLVGVFVPHGAFGTPEHGFADRGMWSQRRV
ncbi:ATP-binding cassette domain-containing protein [Dyella terrae]|uniref:ATP-binding cassette domain-containing protein n=2 Tax=Dyella TaxID=231454 RepID=A0A4R0YU19_9GAMM|nr:MULTISPECIES: ATP-binding cassette domain-containing protein [Dyella]TBR39509.1 ATP-binding cassette domain-containing protein [Dyella terrae]TCI12905.1 ATP-binding cassette domain-containing protein [Dyella soli]